MENPIEQSKSTNEITEALKQLWKIDSLSSNISVNVLVMCSSVRATLLIINGTQPSTARKLSVLLLTFHHFLSHPRLLTETEIEHLKNLVSYTLALLKTIPPRAIKNLNRSYLSETIKALPKYAKEKSCSQ